MREYNCDSLKKLSVPDELIDKALAVPKAASPAKAHPRRRALIAAASVVIAATAGISVYFLTRNINDSPVPVAPAPAATSETAKPGIATEPSEQPTFPDAPSDPTEQVQPAVKPTELPAVTTAQPTEPEHEYKPAVNTPTVRPTVGATESPPVQPAEQPVILPTEPIAAPTDHPEPPEPWEDPTEQPMDEIASVGYMIPLSSYTGDGDIFCRMYSSKGEPMGSVDLYDDSHRVYYATGSGYLMLSYPLGAVGEPLPADSYTLVFYDESGSDFYICSAFLSRK